MVDSKLNISVNFKGTQPQIQRIKKQDEDDHWISEEELYTEGSSDEEKLSHSSKKHYTKGRKSDSKGRKHLSSSSSKSETNEKANDVYCTENNVNVISQSDISWRPKRGSIKLPGIDNLEITHSSDNQ